MIYHAGEIAVQARVGVQAEAESLAQGMGGAIIKPAMQNFLASQRLAIACTIDANNRVWASLLTGKLGFLQAVAEQIVKIDIDSDELKENLRLKDELGLLVIDLATRRRLRLNGKAKVQDKKIYLHTQQVYFNCPQYIQKREIKATTNRGKPNIQIGATLSPQQQQFIQQADTFFIASFHPQSGADASHRGGYPGFVRVLQKDELVFPDYAGNNMFNTLGNLVENPQAGLLFIDFATGDTLQLTGKAAIAWDSQIALEFAGAERLVEFQIEKVKSLSATTPWQWQFKEYSPYLPMKTKPLTD
ncbi:MAG: pyridoxamine 5'-phosphate oxidase family protein [Chroococcus sp. CMT-3BRIN-NPC107]|jgi:hypothetical protein|nr:pyridoxamine 5'-phosphate oxidase family protein [Chroococcus sp. CMT-3BRIN-NPC107]